MDTNTMIAQPRAPPSGRTSQFPILTRTVFPWRLRAETTHAPLCEVVGSNASRVRGG